jgi:serine/threonine protein kinase
MLAMALELSIGDKHGGFEVLQVLRKYPHAWVYKVRAPGHEEPVALKLSLEPVRSDELARRALREVAVLENITNPHVLKVLGSGLTEGEHWFILMEHLAGAQLNHWHDFDRPLPAADAVGIVHQACLGLAELHAQGIVHRDLKPERLWITPDGTVKLLDFSHARSWGEGATGDNVTVGVQVAGAPEYASPEQAFGVGLSPAADVYSLAVILYEMLTGRSPLYPALKWSEARTKNADDPGLWMRAHARSPVTPLRDHAIAEALPQRLADVVEKSLAKEAKDRPASAAELANELGWILHHDLGAAQAGILRVTPSGEGKPRYALVLPGSHRLGTGEGVELKIGDEGPEQVAAVIEWSGAPKLAELVAQSEGITKDGEPVTERVTWGVGEKVRIGDVELSLTYPKPKKA